MQCLRTVNKFLVIALCFFMLNIFLDNSNCIWDNNLILHRWIDSFRVIIIWVIALCYFYAKFLSGPYLIKYLWYQLTLPILAYFFVQTFNLKCVSDTSFYTKYIPLIPILRYRLLPFDIYLNAEGYCHFIYIFKCQCVWIDYFHNFFSLVRDLAVYDWVLLKLL